VTHLSFNTCRFCSDRNQSMVKYGTRHYAHFKCYLDAGKSLSDLHAWQLRSFPYFLLKERGLLDTVKQLLEAAQQRELQHDRFMSKVRS
jgi:hypothetical protein